VRCGQLPRRHTVTFGSVLLQCWFRTAARLSATGSLRPLWQSSKGSRTLLQVYHNYVLQRQAPHST
jgi:hypothetical protein